MRHYFNFDGVISSAYGVLISEAHTFGAPARDIEEITVPGRDGNLTIDNGRFDAASLVYPAYIPDRAQANLPGLRNALMSKRGHRRLQDSLHADEFYLAYYEKGLEPELTPNLYHAALEIEFTRDPRRFLTAGGVPVSVDPGDKLYNPTLFASKPLIRVYGQGVLSIDNMTVTVTGSYPYVDIDAEIGDCYYGATNANSVVTFSGYDFPMLRPGENTVTYTGFTDVEITPRWWRL